MSNKIGVNISIDVTKIDKSKLFKGAKGTYLDMTVFISPDEPDQYQNHGMVTQAVTKDEKQQGVKGAILGNCKVFWRDGNSPRTADKPVSSPVQPVVDEFDTDSIPF